MLRVNEIFDTLQGEGARTGRPSTFIRLQGCPVGCGWCDTKHTWSDGRLVSFEEIKAKDGTAPDARCAEVDAATLRWELLSRRARHAVFTGGEPALYDLIDVTELLHRAGIATQIETSGTFALRISPATWVTCSPKVGMPGGYAVRPAVLMRADEIKVPIGKARDVEAFEQHVLPHLRPSVEIYLQPLSCSASATKLCQSIAFERGWNVSIQLHKYLGIR